MFLSLIPQLWYDKTYIVWICSIIIWYWLFFVIFVIWLIPYIGWWQYVWEEFMIINIRDFFLNTLLGHSWIVINFVRYCTINIFQAKNSMTRKQNVKKYIAILPWLIFMNITDWFFKFVIGRNNDELYRRYSGLKSFPHPQIYVHPNKISSHSILISTK